MGRIYRWGAGPVSAGMVLTSLMATVALATSLSAFGLLSPLPGLRDLDYTQDTFGRVAPLRADFIAQSLGQQQLDRILNAFGPAAKGGEPARGGTRPAPPAPRGSGKTLVPDLIGSHGWHLVIELSADKTVVRPQDTITFTYVVRNIGTEEYGTVGEDPNLLIESHIPEQTKLTEPRTCEVGSLTDPVEPFCNQVPSSEQAPTNPQHHDIRDDNGGITPCLVKPGDPERNGPNPVTGKHEVCLATYTQSFRVTVDAEAQQGTEITNHAHLSGAGQGEEQSGELRIPVEL